VGLDNVFRIQTLLDLSKFKLRKFRLAQFKETKSKEVLNKVSQTGVESSLAGIKAQRNQGDGRILLGDNTGCGAVMLRPIRFQCVGIWNSTGLPLLHIYVSSYVGLHIVQTGAGHTGK
jgi:hypothetical protein